jgi:hypothetical protein
VAPPGNQAANGENKLQSVAMEDPSLLDIEIISTRLSFSSTEIGRKEKVSQSEP